MVRQWVHNWRRQLFSKWKSNKHPWITLGWTKCQRGDNQLEVLRWGQLEKGSRYAKLPGHRQLLEEILALK